MHHRARRASPAPPHPIPLPAPTMQRRRSPPRSPPWPSSAPAGRGAEQRYGNRAEALHGKGKIEECIACCKDFAREAERAHVERCIEPAMLRRGHGSEKAPLAEGSHSRSARRITIV